MRIVLLCSSFNGLTQRVWTDLLADGHDVVVRTADSGAAMRAAVAAADPDVIICPVPEGAHRTRPRRRGGTSTRSTTCAARSSPARTSSSSRRSAATRAQAA